MRYIFGIVALAFSSMTFANTYANCGVDSIMTHDQLPNLVIVSVSCVAPDAITSGPNCTSGTINPKAFVFDSSTATGKAHLALVLTAMASGNTILANTYGSCPPNVPDTTWLYSLRVYKP